MRVLHLRNTCGYYGAERCIVSWMRELGDRGFTFDLVAYDHPDPSTETFFAEAREAGAEVHRLPREHRHGVSALGRLVSVVRRRRVELIHAHENRSHVMGWLAGGITGTPVVGSVHGYVAASGRSTRLNRLNRWFLSGHRLARLTAPTEELVRQLGVAELVPNAIAGNGASDELAADALPGIPTFGVVSRLSPEKNVAAFLSAIASLPPHWRFEVLGEGPESDRLHDHPEAGRVRWWGFQPDAAERMRGWTALVIPSRSEGLPLTLLEAMAAGVPVVATGVGGVPDAVENGRHAILVPRDDPGALGDGMRQVVADPAGARVRAEAARERFRERYTLTRVGDDLERLYRSVARGALVKILEIEVFGRGGLTHYVYNLARELGQRGHQVTIATAADYELVDRISALPDTVHLERVLSRGAHRVGRRLPYRMTRHLKGIEFFTDSITIRRLVGRLDPDVVHIHCTNPIILWTMMLLRSLECPVVYTAHDVTPHERVTLQDVLYRRIYGLSDHVVAHSERDRERLAAEFGLTNDRVSVIPHGDYGFFDVAEMGQDREGARRRLDLEPDEEVALFFGFIREYKGLDLLLDAWPAVARARPRARLVIAGDPARLDPARRKELADRAVSLGAILRFAYVPFEEVSTYFAAADTLVLPYRNISQSGVLLLSLSVGLPVIATRVGAFPEVLTDEESALLISADSVTELESALVRLLGDPALRGRLAAGGREVANAYSWPTIAERTDALFARLRSADREPAILRP